MLLNSAVHLVWFATNDLQKASNTFSFSKHYKNTNLITFAVYSILPPNEKKSYHNALVEFPVLFVRIGVVVSVESESFEAWPVSSSIEISSIPLDENLNHFDHLLVSEAQCCLDNQ